jgi:SPP1 gp7 family putative phage head morphogenesis protein
MDNKLTKDQQFFIDRTLEFTKEIYDKCEEQLNPLYNLQKKNRDKLLAEIAAILLSYHISDNILNLSAVDKKKLYLNISNSIAEKMKIELKVETNSTKGMLLDAAKLKYSTNNYIYSLGIDYKLTQAPEEVLNKIVDEKIDGEIWSKRIWSNKNDLANDLKIQVKKFLKGEINVNDIEKVIKTKYNANASNTSRLVKTEITRVQSASNDYWAKEHNIEQQLFMATLDNRTSEICRSHDGQVFDIDDADKPMPPLHPYCRSCLINLPNKDWKPKMRINNETKQNVDWGTYQEWESNQ